MSSLGVSGTVEELHAKHSAAANLIFLFKSRVLIARRFLEDATYGELFRCYRRLAAIPAGARLLADDEHRLYSSTSPRERDLELGKAQNLRVAASAIDGTVLEPGE